MMGERRIAQVPQAIRGFGHIKDAAVKAAKAEEERLWARWEAYQRLDA